jgi:hypothetical protein
MPVIPGIFNATLDISSLTLVRYAQIIRYDENAFFGINAPDNRERACRKIWTKLERDMVARNLGTAQAMIEQTLMYPLGQKWFVNEPHKNVNRFFTQWSHIQALGIRAESVIASGVALNHTNDPATIPATATTVTVTDEIHFYQAGTDVEVHPDTLTIAGGFVNATFPRARLVKESEQDNPDTGWSYTDTSSSGPYMQTLDIKRVYTDTTDVGEFVWPLGKDCLPECGEETEPACGYVRSSESGVVTLLPSNGSGCFYCNASGIRLNYCAGKAMDSNAEDAIVHLAHALMAVMPCESCDPLMMLWKQDRFIPENVTLERANAKFGLQEGAWRAWIYAFNNRHFRTTFI